MTDFVPGKLVGRTIEPPAAALRREAQTKQAEWFDQPDSGRQRAYALALQAWGRATGNRNALAQAKFLLNHSYEDIMELWEQILVYLGESVTPPTQKEVGTRFNLAPSVVKAQLEALQKWELAARSGRGWRPTGKAEQLRNELAELAVRISREHPASRPAGPDDITRAEVRTGPLTGAGRAFNAERCFIFAAGETLCVETNRGQPKPVLVRSADGRVLTFSLSQVLLLQAHLREVTDG